MPDDTPPPVDDVPAWLPNKVYLRGDKASYDGAIYEAKWWTRGDTPNSASSASPWKISN